jgi:all-trans-retinol 13,14-reductase
MNHLGVRSGARRPFYPVRRERADLSAERVPAPWHSSSTAPRGRRIVRPMDTREARDVVVIGAGLGGLSAAAYLASRGVSVLVVERHEQPGGYATMFQREPFSFEVSLHLMDAVGQGQPSRKLLDDLGVGDELVFRKPEALRREIWPELDVRVPHGVDAYLRLLGAHFPADRAGLEQLAELARTAHADAIEIGARASLPDTLDTSRFLSLLGALGRRTAADVIDQRIGDRRLRGILDLFAWGWLGLPIEELSAMQWLVPWHSYHEFGGYYPVGGSCALSRALCRVIKAHGGEVRLATPARRIKVQRRRVQGVELAGGRFCTAKAVVSNVSPQRTFGELTDPAEVDPRYLHRMKRMEPSVSCLKVWLGLKAKPRWSLEGPLDYDIYLNPSYERRGAERFDPSVASLSVVVPSHLDPGLVSEGRAMVFITMLMSAEAYAEAEALEPAFRDRAANTLIQRVEAALFPGLRELIEIMEVATPSTFERFTGNPGGSIYGWSARADQCGGARMDAVTPIDGLFLAGAWTQPGGGFTSVLRSGKRTGERILALIRQNAW